jgi:hypothetical protein
MVWESPKKWDLKTSGGTSKLVVDSTQPQSKFLRSQVIVFQDS